jgi:tetratricopeptide (TPR) repeat protein
LPSQAIAMTAPDPIRDERTHSRLVAERSRTIAVDTGALVPYGDDLAATTADQTQPSEKPAESQPLEKPADGPVPQGQPEIAGAPWGEAGPTQRFAVDCILGEGATGHVYAVFDRALERPLAVKILAKVPSGIPGKRQAFLAEARLTAAIQHPGVLPVHDIGMTGQGQPYFAMSRMKGTSLGEVLRQSQPAARHPHIATMNAVVNIALALCRVVTYAHQRGIVHQDIKPDNIFVGEFGEVMLLDWGCARHTGPGAEPLRILGTPLYMSPEQARGETSDALSDQYCLGATLYEMLTLRLPTWDDDTDRFWEKKRRGVVDDLEAAERARIPPALLTIARKAISAGRADRYADVEAMRRDLESYQAGLAVSAYRENPLRACWRWCRDNRRAVSIAVISGVLVLLIAGMWWRDLRRERSAFREVYRDNLTSAAPLALASRWLVRSRGWMESTTVAGSLDDPRWIACTKDGITLHAYDGWTELVYAHHLLGNVHVEWDARALDQPLNLNCFVGSRDRDHGFFFSIGGWDDPTNCVISYGPQALELAHADAPAVVIGTWYHFTLEHADTRLRLWRDGALLFDVRAPKEFTPGDQVFGFDTDNGNRICVAHVVIRTQPLAQLISPLEVGDALFRLDQFPRAAERYQEIRDAYPGTELERDATYRQALCTLRQGDEASGLALLDTFERAAPDDPLVPYAWHERLRVAEAHHDLARAKVLITQLSTMADPALLRLIYSEMVALRQEIFTAHATHQPGDPPFPTDMVAQAESALADIEMWGRQCGVRDHNAELVNAASRCLRFFDRDDLVLAHFPTSHQACALSLLNLGRYDQLCRTYPNFTGPCAQALIAQDHYDTVVDGNYPLALKIRALALAGRLDEALDRYGNDEDCGQWLIAQGRAEEALKRYGRFPEIAAQALARLGRYQEALDLKPSPWTQARCLIGLHRSTEAVLCVPQDSEIAWTAAITMRRDAEVAHAPKPADVVDLERRLATAEIDHDHDGPWFAAYVVPLFLAFHDGVGQNWRDRCTTVMGTHRYACGQRLWHAMALLAGAEDDTAFFNQPSRHASAEIAELLHGIRAEFVGDVALARASYAAVAARKPWQRDLTFCEEAFLSWRMAELTSPTP